MSNGGRALRLESVVRFRQSTLANMTFEEEVTALDVSFGRRKP